MRYFNGEMEPIEGAICLLNICANLDANANFEEPGVAVDSVAQKCLQVKTKLIYFVITSDKIFFKIVK